MNSTNQHTKQGFYLEDDEKGEEDEHKQQQAAGVH